MLVQFMLGLVMLVRICLVILG